MIHQYPSQNQPLLVVLFIVLVDLLIMKLALATFTSHGAHQTWIFIIVNVYQKAVYQILPVLIQVAKENAVFIIKNGIKVNASVFISG